MKFHIYPLGNFTEHFDTYWKIHYFMEIYKFINNISAKECDYFIVPMALVFKPGSFPSLNSLLSQANFYKKYPSRHIFFLTGDWHDTVPGLDKSIQFQRSSSLKNSSPCLHYFTTVSEMTEIDNTIYDVSFMGNYLEHPKVPCRLETIRAINKTKLKTLIKHHNYFENPQTPEIRQEYIKSINQSKFVLCPRGMGLTSIRFFETLALGRIPILIGDETKLPLSWKINYGEIIIRVPENRLDLIEGSVKDFMHHNDLSLVSKKCRQVWETYFDEKSIELFLSENLEHIHQPKICKLL